LSSDAGDAGKPMFVPSAADGTQFSDEAAAEYGLAVTRYANSLEALSVGYCNSELVLLDQVKRAVVDLGPKQNDAGDGLKAFLDWVKRLAFLFIGFSVVQGSAVLRQDPIVKGSVVWLVIVVVLGALLAGAALILDIPAVQRRLARS
jgi:hypothetical protein